MAYTTVSVQGLVTLPTDEPAAGYRLKFELKKADKDSALVVPHQLYYTIPSDGNIDVQLWPNARGIAGTVYYVYLIPPRTADPNQPMGTLTVPDVVGPVNIWDHFDVAPPPSLSDAEAAELAAQAYAASASDSAGSAAQYSAFTRDTVALLLSDTDLTYASGQTGTVGASDYVRTRAEGFSYEVAASGASDHHLTTAGGVKLQVLPGADGFATAEQFGSDGTQGGDSTAIRKCLSAGIPLRLQNKRYFYDGAEIDASPVVIDGTAMPNINADETGLENGTIIQGRFFLSGTDVTVKNFGADLGSATGEMANDALKITAPVGTGKRCHAENVIGFGGSPTDAYHAVLIEGFDRLTGGNIFGGHTYFSVVLKCKNVQLDTVECFKSERENLYLKSDTNFGKTERVNIAKLIVNGDGTEASVLIQSDNAQLESVNIGQIIAKNTADGLKIQSSGVGVNEIIIGSALLIDQSERGVYIEALSGFVKSVLLGPVMMNRIVAKPVEFNGNIDFVQMLGASINYDLSAPVTSDTIVVGADVGWTQFDNILAFKGYDPAAIGVITYNNDPAKNQLGVTNCNVAGVGAPVDSSFEKTISGATNAITVPASKVERRSTVKVKHPSGVASVTGLTNTRYSTTRFPAGYELVIINDDTTDLTIVNSFGNKIMLRGGGSLVLAPHETASFVFGGLVWHQL